MSCSPRRDPPRGEKSHLLYLTDPPSPSPSPSPAPMDIDMPLPSDLATANTDHISSLELALCSNFTCCNTQLPDLHALVEHFEEQHVVVFNLDGMRIYPAPAPEHNATRFAHFPPPSPTPPSLSNSPSSSRSSSVVSSPQTPTTPLIFPTGISSDVNHHNKPNSPPHVYTPFNMATMPDESEYGIGLFNDFDIGPDPYPIIINSSSPFDAYPSSPHKSLKSSPSSSYFPHSKSHDPTVLLDLVNSIPAPAFLGDDDSTTSIITSHHDSREKKSGSSNSSCREREREREKKGRLTSTTATVKSDIVNSTTAVSVAKNAAVKAKARITGGNAKRREKAYRCPTHGCTKSYLNPNGLKYHIEKGTCRFEDSTDSECFTNTENTRGTVSSLTTSPTPTLNHNTTLSSSIPSPNHPPTLMPKDHISHPTPSRLSTTITSGGMSIPTPPITPGPITVSPNIPLTSTAYRIPMPVPTPTRLLNTTLC